jgi:16S rRNA (guanine527-N7)-methyltransferase
VDPTQIADLLHPYVVGFNLPPHIYHQLNGYLDLLLRWNAKTNLTAIRNPEQIVTRHFGESLFAGKLLFAAEVLCADTMLADVGSGAGFPGLPIKLAFPRLSATLIESQNKKATFLKEVVRELRLEDVDVFMGRAEQWGKTADAVTLRAVERFATVLPIAQRLLAPGGRLCLLVGASQQNQLAALPDCEWQVTQEMPGERETLVAISKPRD